MHGAQTKREIWHALRKQSKPNTNTTTNYNNNNKQIREERNKNKLLATTLIHLNIKMDGSIFFKYIRKKHISYCPSVTSNNILSLCFNYSQFSLHD